jgi:flagellar biosynthesis protein FlhG
LAKRGQRVLVLDADLGLANLDVVLNLYPKITLHDVFTGKAKLEEAIIRAPGGFSVLLAGSGMVEYSRLTPEVRDDFLRIMSGLVPHYDVVLLDTGAGISDVVLFAVSLASEVLVVATPEPTSLTDAYATIKVLAGQQKRKVIRMVINQTARLGDGRAITTQLQQVLDRFVTSDDGKPLRLIHMGDIPADTSVRQAIMRRQLLMQTMPGCAAAMAISQLALKIEETIASKPA